MNKKFLRNSFKFTILTSAFLCLFHSPVLRAETAGSTTAERKIDAIAFAPTQVWLSYVKTQFQNSKLDLDQHIDNYQYANSDGSIRFVSERVDFISQIQSKLMSSDNQNASLQISLNIGSAKVMANNFNLQATIQKDLGFGTATLTLDMHCDAVELDLKNSNPAAATITATQGVFNLSQLSWNLSGIQVETKLVGCKEVSGFDQLLKEQIQQNLEQTFVVDSLQHMINEKLNPTIQEKIAGTLASFMAKMNVSNTQKYLFDDKNNLWIYSGNKIDQVFTQAEIQKIKESTKAALLIKKSSLEQYAKGYINDILAKNTISSKKVSGIDHLTCSRFIQFFVWPSLRSLSKCFEMRIQNQIQDFSITNLSDFSVNFKVGSWASGDGHQIAYFESGLDAGLMSSSAHLNSFRGTSNPDFIKWSGKSKRIATGMIQPSIESLLQLSLKQLKDNSILKTIQKNTKFNQISPDTMLIEITP